MLDFAGKLPEAETLCRRAMTERERVLGEMHAETLESVNKLGLVLRQRGKLEEAEVNCRKALEGRETLLGPMHLDTLRSVNNLTLVLENQGKLDEAEGLYRRDLAACEAQLGANHPDTLLSVNNLAVLLKKQGKLQDAEGLYRRALAGSEAQLGAGHPHTLDSVCNLARLLEAKGDHAEVEELLLRAFNGYEARKWETPETWETDAEGSIGLMDVDRFGPYGFYFQVAMRSGSSAQKHQLTTAQVQETAGLDQAPRQLVSNSGPESTTLGWRIAATVNEMESAELEDFVVNLSKSTCRALQKAIGARLEAPPQEEKSRASAESEAIRVQLCKQAASIHPWNDDELDARLEEVIEMFQEPRTAVLNASHLGDALHIAGMNPKDSEVSKVLEDIGNPESLTLPEFKQVMKDELAKWTSKDQVQELPSCFRLFDPQDNGFVPRETVAEIMQHGGNHFSEEMLEDMLKNVPSTREGYDARQLVAFLLDPEAKKEERARRDDSDAEPAELDNQKERAKVVQVEFQSMLMERSSELREEGQKEKKPRPVVWLRHKPVTGEKSKWQDFHLRRLGRQALSVLSSEF
ncbi:unnamed protein product [Durusdinium trenchii]|uniref:EF-hand domain-containing protein n=1 Tax=Durusdinium trenchii TaxID=1381693 RepID=A0ABP0PLN2_9DINO